ncbi:TPA: hypothetical protein ACNV5N_001111 [Citrobacter freundii]
MQHTATTHPQLANTVSIVSTTYGQTLVVLNGKCLLCAPPERGDEARQLASTTAGALNVQVDVVHLDTFATDTTESQLMARFDNRNAGPWYSHAFTIAFSVEYPAKSSDDIPPAELHRALMKRAREFTGDLDALVEACGASYDSYQMG